MLRSIRKNHIAPEGYIYSSYGHPKYLKHAVASVVSLRRYDRERPVALICTQKHHDILKDRGIAELFDYIHILEPERASIVGIKHNIHDYLFFEKNLFLDSDMVWCKNPDNLWTSLQAYEFTVTGTLVADSFFGGPKHLGVIKDIVLRRRRRTLRHFGLTHLSRVQTGLMYAKDYELTKNVCELAQQMLKRKEETHFQSRTLEQGRNEESCEWSIAMAMSRLNVPVYTWLQGYTSPQLDYIADYCCHDEDFEYVVCTYYCDEFVNNFRGIKRKWLRNLLTSVFSLLPGKADYMGVTPYLLHFGWYHQKQPFFEYSERTWNRLDVKDINWVNQLQKNKIKE
ncbi:MAG: hypothetical protein R3281_14015 [Balneolaceae bacterium]|nr:hypothetical protein [Balneolaceae bacterium]